MSAGGYGVCDRQFQASGSVRYCLHPYDSGGRLHARERRPRHEPRDGVRRGCKNRSRSGDRVAYYYKDGNSFEAFFNLTEDEDCLKGKDCVSTNQDIYYFKGVEKNNGTDVTVEYNGREVGTLLVRTINSEKIDLDYDIIADGEHYKGDLLLLTNNSDNTVEYNVSYRDKDNKYLNIKGTFKYNIHNALPVIREEDTIELSVKQEDAIFDEFLDSFGSTNLEDKFLIWYEIMTNPTGLFEEEESSSTA